jgi:signal transduction histidine kinase
MKPQSIAKQLDVKVLLDSEMICYANGDKIMQIFMNLLENAIKYTPEHGRISICGKTSAGYHHIEMSDSGIGISEKDQKNIFDRFIQADLSRKSDGKHGVGLGLSIVNQLIRMHNGKITLKSKINEGSIFTVILPVL